MSTVRCQRCRADTESAGDFCQSCGAYLAWVAVPGPADAPTTPTTVTTLAPTAAPSIRMEITTKSGAGADGTPLTLAVEPGRSADLTIRIRNAGERVEGFHVRVPDLPEGWVEAPARAIDLMPVGIHGVSEGTLTVRLSVPRNPETAAGLRAFTVVAEPTTPAVPAAVVHGTLTIGRFDAVVTSVRPRLASGRRSALFLCDVRNQGNAPVIPTISVDDDKQQCTVEVEGGNGAGMAAIEPGALHTYRIRVRTHRKLLGAPLDHPLRVVAAVEGFEHQPPPQLVSFRQTPYVPPWLPSILLALATLAVAVIALILLWPHKARVPELEGAHSAFAAQRSLTEAGFKKPPLVKRRIAPQIAPGTVIAQDPRAGYRASTDAPVTVIVAVPPATTTIPDLTRHTIKGADGILARDHLVLGMIQPKTHPGRRTVVSQIPRAGTVRPRGTLVNIVVSGPGLVKVPAVRCKTAAAAEAIITAKGFVMPPLPNYVTPGRKVTGQVPAPKVKRRPGTTITLFFKGGKSCRRKKAADADQSDMAAGSTLGAAPVTPAEPGLTYDDGATLRIQGIATSRGRGLEPAWSSDGALLARRVDDTSIFVRHLATSRTVAVPAGGHPWPRRGLGFVPGGTAPVIAYLEQRTRRAALCFVRITGARVAPPSCRSLGALLPRTLAVAPNGQQIAVVAAPADDPATPGVLLLGSMVAGSARASDWTSSRGLVHPQRATQAGAVYDVAYAPHGGQLAIATDLRADGTRGTPVALLTSPQELATLRGARWTKIGACQVAFAPSSAQLAVVVARKRGCGDQPPLGELRIEELTKPYGSGHVAAVARNPVWRPERQP